MIISLVGMSGAGKTYWSSKLSDLTYFHIDCDAEIEKKLEPELVKLGYQGIHDMAKWMGQPYEPQYKENSERYLKLEKQVMEEIFDNIQQKKYPEDNIVIDTTGSIIYTGSEIFKKLKKYSTILYLDTPDDIVSEMYKTFINDPKPIYWGNSYIQKNNETRSLALKRSYKNLLHYRIREYIQYAQVTFDYNIIRHHSFSIEKFIDYLEENNVYLNVWKYSPYILG